MGLGCFSVCHDVIGRTETNGDASAHRRAPPPSWWPSAVWRARRWTASPTTADIGRATFFRYFNSKEDAVAEGMTVHWLNRITAALAAQPEHLSATEAVIGAFTELAARIRRHRGPDP